jgi:putative NIF3 family GTP cyclohydrolase 1 type 2
VGVDRQRGRRPLVAHHPLYVGNRHTRGDQPRGIRVPEIVKPQPPSPCLAIALTA